jgi:hypothetical protein
MYLNNAKQQKNVLTLLPGTVTSQVGSPSNNTAMAIFELRDDEALVLELDEVPNGTYWSFQLGDVWSRSLDFTNRQSSLNDREIKVDADGRVRCVVSCKDPGIANWLDPCGRTEGTVVFRNYRALSAPVPASRKVLLSELDTLLPKGTQRVTRDERNKSLRQRRLGQTKLYGE